ncbi:MAG: PAS domain-containing sensor histidine kinase [Planctomycetota bacterium]|jgi:PAS domain S-box-containing protein
MSLKKTKIYIFLVFLMLFGALIPSAMALTQENENSIIPTHSNLTIHEERPLSMYIMASSRFSRWFSDFIYDYILNVKIIIGLLLIPIGYFCYRLIRHPFVKDKKEIVSEPTIDNSNITFTREEFQKYIDEKVQQRTKELEQTNEVLKRNVTKKLPVTEGNLQHRLKHLNCLYGLSELIEQPDMPLYKVFQNTAEIICDAYEHPETTCTGITFDGILYKSQNYEKSEISQYTEIKVAGKKAGGITVYYLGPKPQDEEIIFTQEEHDLLHAVGARLGGFAEQKKGEDRLNLFRYLVDRSNDCIFLIEPKWGRFLDVNEKACQTLGYNKDELLAMSIKTIEQSFVEDSSWQELVSQLQDQNNVLKDGEYTRKDKSSFFVEISFNYVKQDSSEYILALARDISERKEAEEQQASLIEKLKDSNREVEKINQELKDFAYIVSHDLKAPLRGIKTLADWLSSDYADAFDGDGKEQMNLLLTRVGRMHDLIEGILQYSRAGRAREESIWVNLNELIPDVIDILAPPENIKITVESELPEIHCDKTRIGQVFQNLISNSIKYMDKPNGKIKIDYAEEDDVWKFIISDNGPGIEEKHFDRIFRMFQTLTPKDEFESTGVGLTVARKIVQLYDGKIWLESKLEKGTTFFFTFPKQQKEQIDEKLTANTAC